MSGLPGEHDVEVAEWLLEVMLHESRKIQGFCSADEDWETDVFDLRLLIAPLTDIDSDNFMFLLGWLMRVEIN